MKLAEILPYATGFAVEPGELTALFEGFGGILPSADTAASKQGVEVFQIETKNPHFHEEKGGRHLNNMLVPGQAIIYHSPLCGKALKEQIRDGLIKQGAITPEDELVKPLITPPLRQADLPRFISYMKRQLPSYAVLES